MVAVRTHTVAVLVFDGVRLLDVTGPIEVLDVAVTLGAGYLVTLCSATGADVVTSGGLRLGVDQPVSRVGPVDTLLVPGGECLVSPGAGDELVRHVRHLGRQAGRVVSICAGAFLLGDAGLLLGRRATTHWRHTAELRRRFPGLTVDEDAVYVRDGHVLTSAGVSAGIDLALGLVEEDCGAETAHEIARDMVVFARRRSDQPQLSSSIRLPQPRRDPIRRLCDEIVADPGRDHSVANLAARSGLSQRHLSRLFKEQTGLTPAVYAARVRLEAAIGLAEAGETLSVAARRSGLGSADTLRRHLRDRGPH